MSTSSFASANHLSISSQEIGEDGEAHSIVLPSDQQAHLRRPTWTCVCRQNHALCGAKVSVPAGVECLKYWKLRSDRGPHIVIWHLLLLWKSYHGATSSRRAYDESLRCGVENALLHTEQMLIQRKHIEEHMKITRCLSLSLSLKVWKVFRDSAPQNSPIVVVLENLAPCCSRSRAHNERNGNEAASCFEVWGY